MKASVSRGTSALLPRDDARAEHVWVAPQGPLGSPAPRGPHVEPPLVGPVRDIIGLLGWRRLFLPGGEAHRTKMSDVHAERAPGAVMDPTDQWGTLDAHVVTAKGARRASEGV